MIKKEIIEQIKGYITSDTAKEKFQFLINAIDSTCNSINMEYDLYVNGKKSIFLVLYHGDIDVSVLNKQGIPMMTHRVKEVYTIHKIIISNEYIAFKNEFNILRTRFSDLEVENEMIHPHFSGRYIDSEYIGNVLSDLINDNGKSCLGSSEINDIIMHINKTINKNDYIIVDDIIHYLKKLFLYVNMSYLTTQSNSGVPYIHIEQMTYSTESSTRIECIDNHNSNIVNIINAVKEFIKGNKIHSKIHIYTIADKLKEYIINNIKNGINNPLNQLLIDRNRPYASSNWYLFINEDINTLLQNLSENDNNNEKIIYNTKSFTFNEKKIEHIIIEKNKKHDVNLLSKLNNMEIDIPSLIKILIEINYDKLF